MGISLLSDIDSLHSSLHSSSKSTTIGNVNNNMPHLMQSPCNWGVMYFPKQWREFVDFIQYHVDKSFTNNIIIPSSLINEILVSNNWKKYLFEFMYIKSYFMSYPNFNNNVTLCIPQKYILNNHNNNHNIVDNIDIDKKNPTFINNDKNLIDGGFDENDELYNKEDEMHSNIV
jgi:hypothetical protein